jgi:ABC-type nitrate/sulfonate/bicarbonate transport system substrate-binding protein
MGSADALVSAAAGGADLVSVAGMVNGLTQAIGANKKYESIKELRGTIFGVQSLASGATTVLKRIFKKTGLDYPADYKLLAVGGGNFNLAALTSELGGTKPQPDGALLKRGRCGQIAGFLPIKSRR